MLDGDGYEQWVAGHDPVTGLARGRLRQDSNAVRFVEITVNGPKTWSLAAALVPEVAAAYDAAQDRAAEQIIAWVAEHATTRVGPRGRQVQVPVERIEAVTVRHYTSRAGDPHRHLHLQINARVFAGPYEPVAWPAHGRVPRLHRGAQRHRPRGRDVRPGVPRRTGRGRLHPRPAHRRGRRAGALRRGVQRAGRADRTQHRPVRGANGGPPTPARSPARSFGGPGTGEPGRTPDPTRSSPPTAPRWSRTGTSSSTTWATATHHRSPGCPYGRWRAPRVGGFDRDAVVETMTGPSGRPTVGVERRGHPR